MSKTNIERTEGEPGRLAAAWDQQHASAVNLLRRADAFVVLTYNADRDAMEMRAGANCLDISGMVELLTRTCRTSAEMAYDLCEDEAA